MEAQYQDLHWYAKQMVTEKGLGYLPEDVLAQLESDVFTRLESRVNAMILEKMPPEAYEEFERLLSEADDQTIQAFCSQKIPDLQEKVAKVLLDFRQSYLMG